MPNTRPLVSLLTALRGRAEHLERQRLWLELLRHETDDLFEWVIVEGDARPSVAANALPRWSQYAFVEMHGPFNKALLLNKAAELARAPRLCPFDVDLLPARGTLQRHCRLAAESESLIMTGFRLNLTRLPTVPREPALIDSWAGDLDKEADVILAPEDSPSAHLKYLLAAERFGQCPFFSRQDWDRCGGFDEGFVGWGAEDADLLHRVIRLGRTLVRSYDLLYFHMPHGSDVGWHDPILTRENRDRYRRRLAQG